MCGLPFTMYVWWAMVFVGHGRHCSPGCAFVGSPKQPLRELQGCSFNEPHEKKAPALSHDGPVVATLVTTASSPGIIAL